MIRIAAALALAISVVLAGTTIAQAHKTQWMRAAGDLSRGILFVVPHDQAVETAMEKCQEYPHKMGQELTCVDIGEVEIYPNAESSTTK